MCDAYCSLCGAERLCAAQCMVPRATFPVHLPMTATLCSSCAMCQVLEILSTKCILKLFVRHFCVSENKSLVFSFITPVLSLTDLPTPASGRPARVCKFVHKTNQTSSGALQVSWCLQGDPGGPASPTLCGEEARPPTHLREEGRPLSPCGEEGWPLPPPPARRRPGLSPPAGRRVDL